MLNELYGDYKPKPLILIESYEEVLRALETAPNADYDLTGMMGSHNDLQVLEAILTIASHHDRSFDDHIIFIPLDLERSVDLLKLNM